MNYVCYDIFMAQGDEDIKKMKHHLEFVNVTPGAFVSICVM